MGPRSRSTAPDLRRRFPDRPKPLTLLVAVHRKRAPNPWASERCQLARQLGPVDVLTGLSVIQALWNHSPCTGELGPDHPSGRLVAARSRCPGRVACETHAPTGVVCSLPACSIRWAEKAVTYQVFSPSGASREPPVAHLRGPAPELPRDLKAVLKKYETTSQCRKSRATAVSFTRSALSPEVWLHKLPPSSSDPRIGCPSASSPGAYDTNPQSRHQR